MNKYIIPQLVKYCPDKDFAKKIEHSFATNTTGLKKIDLDLYIPMFGYKNCDDYNQASVMTGRFKDIKVPTFCLSTDND